MADNDLYWLAGILEGEGCFHNRSTRYCSPLIQLVMTDKDVVIRAAKIMGAHKVVCQSNLTKGGKQIFRANVYGTTATELMRALLPMMGERRSKRIEEILALFDSRPRSPYPERKAYSRGSEICWSKLQ